MFEEDSDDVRQFQLQYMVIKRMRDLCVGICVRVFTYHKACNIHVVCSTSGAFLNRQVD